VVDIEVGVDMKNMLFNEKILIVDDEEIIISYLKDLLSGYNIVTASDGMEALEKLRENIVFLIITDFKMPRMDGGELLKLVKEQKPDIPVYLLTAFGGRNIVESGDGYYFDGLFDKPVDDERLIEKVDELFFLRRDKMLDEIRSRESQALLQKIENKELKEMEKSLQLLRDDVDKSTSPENIQSIKNAIFCMENLMKSIREYKDNV